MLYFVELYYQRFELFQGKALFKYLVLLLLYHNACSTSTEITSFRDFLEIRNR